ncbi:uncharacterized mitochondrial protein AtMg00310-like [Cornus florida]|uniref:uncharacterized mitochondrial protein AtMg00310-like n=1 Tax=Cornus florida TaxID=4283 RepID=UPI00289EF18C|nr:uncharacterized mitochondrial protein AtMg00310-like [Cornus florida]
MCQSKRNGGLGFRNVEAFNTTFLAKLAWRMEIGDDSLLYKSFKQKYFKNCDFLEALKSRKVSGVWKGIFSVQAVIKKGMKWRIGDGNDVNCWLENWLPDRSKFSVSSQPFGASISTVAELINPSTHK